MYGTENTPGVIPWLDHGIQKKLKKTGPRGQAN
ncbi:permease [Rickettsia sp.]